MNIESSQSISDTLNMESSKSVSQSGEAQEQSKNPLESVNIELLSSQINKDLGLEKLEENIEKINRDIEPFNTKLKYSVHEKTQQILVKIVDKNTDEIIKEIPPEKLVDMKASMLEMAGLLVDKNA